MGTAVDRREEPPVCQPVLCRVCGKVTWTGCGEHVEQALAGIPPEYHCPGHAPSPAAPPPTADPARG